MARELNKYDIMAHEAAEAGKPLDWFEEVYSGAITGEHDVPWGNKVANPFMERWLDENYSDNEAGKTALKIGCGLGDDAESLSQRGFETTAFDIAPSAIATAEKRFPASLVNYEVADLFNAPVNWKNSFDLVIEIFTIQALPLDLRKEACARVASFLKPGGRLFVVSFGMSGIDANGNLKPVPSPLKMPWPLTREDLATFKTEGLKEVSFSEVVDPDNSRIRRFVVEYLKG